MPLPPAFRGGHRHPIGTGPYSRKARGRSIGCASGVLPSVRPGAPASLRPRDEARWDVRAGRRRPGAGRRPSAPERSGGEEEGNGVKWMKNTLPALAAAAFLPCAPPALSGDLDRALVLADEHRDAEAREALSSLLEREPDNPRARLLLGVLLAREERVDEAIGVFEGLRRDHPDLPEPYNNLAVLHAMQGRLEEAREALLAAIERRPDFAAAHANLSDVYARLAHRASVRARELDSGAGAPPARGGRDRADPAARAAESRPRPAPAPASAPGAAPARAAFCARAEGFEDRAAAAGAERWLRARGLEVEVRVEERESIRSLVYLPPLASAGAAAAKVREIRARGVRDVGVIRTGPFANGISFGLYTVEANTRRRIAALERLGFAVQRAPSPKRFREYALEARAGPAAGRAGLDAAWTSRFPDYPLRTADCGSR